MKLFFGVTILVFSMLGAAFGQCSDTDKAALEAFDRAWAKAGQTGDKAALMNIYADNFMALPAMTGKATAIENTMADFERNQANPQNNGDVTYDRYLMSCSGNSATVTHRNIFSSNDGSRELWSRSVHVMEKKNGKWQVVSTTGHAMDDNMILYYMDQDWTEANRTRNKDWFEKNFASDFTSISSSTGKLYNKAEDIAGTMDEKGTVEMTESTDVNIRVDGNSAVITGIYRWKGKDEKGVAYDNRVRYTDTYIKRDGRWQVWATAGSAIKD